MSPCPKMVSVSREGGTKFYTEVDACRRIFKGDFINWLYTSRKNNIDYIFHDDYKGNEEDLENSSTAKGGEDKEPVSPKKGKETKPSSGPKAKQVAHKRKPIIEDHFEKKLDEETHSNKGDEENNRGSTFIIPSNSLEITQVKTPPNMPQVLELTPQASIFQGIDYFYSTYKKFVANLWGTIHKTLNAIPTDEISSFKEMTKRNIQLMKIDGLDISALEQRVVDFFKMAQDYDQIRSRTFEASS
nr:uncharacterized protein LOC109157601 [Ipomoea trifida]